jgi:hypothetical protein
MSFQSKGSSGTAVSAALWLRCLAADSLLRGFCGAASIRAPANAAAAAIPHGDEHQLPAGEHCAPWLEQTYMPASTLALPAVDPQGGIDAVPPAKAWPVARMLVLKVVPRAGAPPPP